MGFHIMPFTRAHLVLLLPLLPLPSVQAGALYCTGGQSDLVQRFQNVITNLDNDHSGVFSHQDYFNFYRYMDSNLDSCISKDEFVARMASYFKFSTGYASHHFPTIVKSSNPACPINYHVEYGVNKYLDMTTDDVINPMLQTLIEYCEADRTRYISNCDCKQLPDSCSHNSYFRLLQQCRDYLTHINPIG